MSTIDLNNIKKQIIYDSAGEPEYIVLNVADFEWLMETLEDYNLGKAMLVAENTTRYGKDEALKILDNDTD
jgi:hypothetical protein